MAKATKTIKQQLCYKSAHRSYFATTKTLFNQVAAFYFDVLVAHRGVLELSSEEALTALETLTHTTKDNPHPVMPLASAIPADLPAMFRRAALHAALGAARSFYSHLEKWRKQKAKAQAKGKQFTIRPPVPPRRIHSMGWLRVYQVLFAHYGCATSRSHATYTPTPDYATVPEEAAPLLVAAECHI